MTTYVLAGTLLARPGEEPLHKQTITIDKGRIVSVTPVLPRPSPATR